MTITWNSFNLDTNTWLPITNTITSVLHIKLPGNPEKWSKRSKHELRPAIPVRPWLCIDGLDPCYDSTLIPVWSYSLFAMEYNYGPEWTTQVCYSLWEQECTAQLGEYKIIEAGLQLLERSLEPGWRSTMKAGYAMEAGTTPIEAWVYQGC